MEECDPPLKSSPNAQTVLNLQPEEEEGLHLTAPQQAAPSIGQPLSIVQSSTQLRVTSLHSSLITKM